MKTHPQIQMKVVQVYTDQLNTNMHTKRNSWTKEQAMKKIKDTVLGGSHAPIKKHLAN